MKVVVTGATGFVGRHLAEKLHADGFEIHATGRSHETGEALRSRGIAFQSADILDVNQLAGAFTPADCVIHCAGKSGDWGRFSEFYEGNVVGTRNVVQQCNRLGIDRMIFISTPSIYYTGENRFNIRETDELPRKQTAHYGRTKLMAEDELMALCRHQCRIIILRPRVIYGPRENTFMPRILRMADGKRVPLIDGGKALVDMTYIDNFVDAIRSSLNAPDHAWNEVYNLSNGDPITVREWFSTVLRSHNRPFRPKNVPVAMAMIAAYAMELAARLPFGVKRPSMTRFSVGYLARSMTLNIDKARQKLQYAPRIGSREGLEKCAERAS